MKVKEGYIQEDEVSYCDMSGILSLDLPDFLRKNHLRFLVQIPRTHPRATGSETSGERPGELFV